jgi:hypothetical protein
LFKAILLLLLDKIIIKQEIIIGKEEGSMDDKRIHYGKSGPSD